MSLPGALWGRGWYPHMGGALKGAQIGLGGLSRAGARARVRMCVCVRAWVSDVGVPVEHVFDDAGHTNWCPFRLDSPCLGVCIVKPSARGSQPHKKGSQQ